MSRSKTTSSPVAVSIAVIRSTRSGHSCDGSRCAITSRRTASGDGVGGQRDRADLLQLLGRGGVRRQHRGDEQLGDVVDGDAGVDLVTTPRRSAGRTTRRGPAPLPSWAATVEPAEVPSNTSESSRRRPPAGASSAIPAAPRSPRRCRPARRRPEPVRVVTTASVPDAGRRAPVSGRCDRHPVIAAAARWCAIMALQRQVAK